MSCRKQQSTKFNLVILAPVGVGQAPYSGKIHDTAWGIFLEVAMVKSAIAHSQSKTYAEEDIVAWVTNLITSSRFSSLA
jgi:hypothetical protein